MRVRALLIALASTSACAVSSPTNPSSGPWKFSGTVSRMEGQKIGGPIAGAELTVIRGVNVNANVTTDQSGRYVFTGLESGRFTVTVVAPGYRSATPVVDLYRDIEAHFALPPQ